nr:hypothetical protein [Colwellia sp. M166]
MQITNDKTLIAELAVFPKDLSTVSIGAKTTLTINGVEEKQVSKIDSRILKVRKKIRLSCFGVVVNNHDSLFSEGSFVSAAIEISSYDVAMAVKRSGLQSFRDFTVVYAKVGDEYEVRMLELGRAVGEEIEVLSGISFRHRNTYQKIVTSSKPILKNLALPTIIKGY